MTIVMSSGGSAAGVLVPPSAPAHDRELKFTLPAGRVDLARRWLQTVCRPDPEYPAADVWTIYYDTSKLDSLNEKINSDYLKLKIRLRWYAEIGRAPSGPVFLEAKQREGTRRTKVRLAIPDPAEHVSSWGLQDARLQSLLPLLHERGIVLRDRWQPFMIIRYRRDRFVEPISQTRIALDAEIAAAAVNPRFLSAADPTPLGLGILEVKGGAEQLPVRLRPLLQLGARKRSFSKFLALYQHVTRSIF